MHHLLEQQIIHIFGALDKFPKELESFINDIDDTYKKFDVERAAFKKTLDKNSSDLSKQNVVLQNDIKIKESQALELEKTKLALLNVVEDEQESLQKLKKNTHILKEAERIGKSGSYELNIKSGKWTSSEVLNTIFGIDDSYERTIDGWLNLIHPDDREDMKNYYQGLLTKNELFDKEYRILRKNDKNVSWVHGLGEFEREKNNQPITLTGLIQDITERKISELKIAELNELRDKFIQIVSHQLRTPLSAISWNLESLLSEDLGKLKESQKEFIKITYDANKEIIKRIHGLLTAIDIEEGRIRVVKEKSSIESVWGSVMSAWKKDCMLKNISCSYTPPEKPLQPINIDIEKIRIIFEKLVENAIEYTPEKGKITASIKKYKDKIRFEITDNGIGIPKAEQKSIFKRFFRASNSFTSKPDASGLGLYIAKNFIEAQGGKMNFKSTENEGSTFWFDIPSN